VSERLGLRRLAFDAILVSIGCRSPSSRESNAVRAMIKSRMELCSASPGVFTLFRMFFQERAGQVLTRAAVVCGLGAACSPCLPIGGGTWRSAHNEMCETLDQRPDCRPTPRCSAQDPQCGPAPLNTFEGCYRPGGRRFPLSPQPNPSGALVPPEAIRCDHDGECVVASCGTACRSYGFADLPGTLCAKPTRTSALLCGCVHGTCQGFHQ